MVRAPTLIKLILGLFLIVSLPHPILAAPPSGDKIVTLDDELASCYIHLESVEVQDRPYIKFFTFMGTPPHLREDAVLVTSMWLHSLTGVPDKTFGGNTGYYAPLAVRAKIDSRDKNGKPKSEFIFVPKQRVKGSETVYWIDIRDYNWTEKAWELVSSAEAYIRKPYINEAAYDAIRVMSGNALVRADWFLANTADVTKQADFDPNNIALNTSKSEPFYYTLLYANTKIPRNGTEYRDIWGVNLQRINDNQLARGTIVDRGQSVVSRNARELARGGLDTGYHWESSDFKQNRGRNDPIEHLSIERNKNGRAVHVNLGRKSDAHEFITSNLLGLQVYFLTDGKENRVEFADPTIVRDASDRTDDIRVRTARSCVVCHPYGINIPSDALRQYLDDGVDLIIGTKEYRQAVKQFLLTDLGALIQDDQVRYARSVVQTNGLLPEENARTFQKVMDWYDRDVLLAQAARECGVSVEEFKEKVGRVAKGRLARLTKAKDQGYGIPRHLWDDPNMGDFQLAMLAIHDQGALPIEKEVETTVTQIEVLEQRCSIMLGKTVLKWVPKGTRYDVVEKINEWYKVKYEGEKTGYLWENWVKVISENEK